MIRGIGGKPYIDLDPYLDIEGFKKLHIEMCYGLAMAEWKKIGNMVKPGGCEDITWPFKPIFRALEEYYALPGDHQIRQYGKKIGELDNRNNFINYLKLSMGAYDPYEFVFLKSESGGWESRFEEKDWTSDAKLFPGLVIWLKRLVDQNIFTHLGRIIFFKSEHGVVMPKHRDLILPNETEYTDHLHEFIHIRSTMNKKFYVWDSATDTHCYISSHACFFNDQDYHGGEPDNVQTFSLRIDGCFTDEFRKKLNTSHLAHY